MLALRKQGIVITGIIVISWATLLVVIEAAGVQGPPIMDLMKPSTDDDDRMRGVQLKDYGPDFSVLLSYPKSDMYSQTPKFEAQTGEFFVAAPPGHGLMVVIQYLQLRTQFKGSSRNSLSEYCRDFIKISDSSSYGNKTDEICGYVLIKHPYRVLPQLIGPRTFFAPGGQVVVSVRIDGNNGTDMAKFLDSQFQISFTATAECDEKLIFATENATISDVPPYKPCFNASMVDYTVPPGLCIASGLFCDGVNQCGYNAPFASIIGTDELGCKFAKMENPMSKPRSGGGRFLVIIFIIVSIVVVVGIFGFLTSPLGAICRRRRYEGSTAVTSEILKQSEHNIPIASTSSDNEGGFSSFNVEQSR